MSAVVHSASVGSPRPDLHAAIAGLAQISMPAGRGVTREVFTPLYAQACEVVSELMISAGMQVSTDVFGNLRGSLVGEDPKAAVVLTGSHIDTTLDAGAYDGVLGVLGAVAAVGELAESGVRLRRSIDVVAFAGEEPRFGLGCIGSRALMGQLTRLELDEMVDRNGITLAEAMRASGFDPDALPHARIAPDTIHAFVELHIEQGAVLESAGAAIGVVHRIAAPHDLRVTLTGKAMHAGATPMHLRRDAFAGAAEAATILEQLALSSSSETIVATIGALQLLPGAINIIPGTVVFDVDIRDSELEPRERLISAFIHELEGLADRRHLGLEVTTITSDTPASCDPMIVDAVSEACQRLGVRSMQMMSGAYHDAMIVGRHAPMGMIFVPSRDGLSHHPDEFTSPHEIDLGVDILRETLASLAEPAA